MKYFHDWDRVTVPDGEGVFGLPSGTCHQISDQFQRVFSLRHGPHPQHKPAVVFIVVCIKQH